MKIELGKFATRFMLGVLAILALTAMYGPTGWNVLVAFITLTAYRVGRAVGPERKQNQDKETP